VEYFNTKLENVKVVKVNPEMYDIKDPSKEKHNHLERVNCVTKKSPGPTKTATSFIPIAGTNAPPRNCSSSSRRRCVGCSAHPGAVSMLPGIHELAACLQHELFRAIA
jgi:hypothetical protein